MKKNSQKTVHKMKKNHGVVEKMTYQSKTEYSIFVISDFNIFFQIALISKQSKIEECGLHEATGNFL